MTHKRIELPLQDDGCENCPHLPHAEDIAERAATKAIEKVFLRLGIDSEDLESLAYWQDNFAFLARANRGAKQVSSILVKTCVGAAVSGFLYLVWEGVRHYFKLA